MKIELESVFNTPGMTVSFAAELPEDHARASGIVRNHAGIVEMEGTATVSQRIPCDRCAEDFDFTCTIPISHTLVREIADEEDDAELTLISDWSWDPSELLHEDVVLGLPPVALCSADCKGLCPSCGCNRNMGECTCVPESQLAFLLRDFPPPEELV
ncbi:MAG: DUF177 domain-containing protein [Oscillospiraceae bacterium]|jgi:uncharacterized protein|nr:DUF177 domain-containing protein [Oscillospiraceae bacterium]